VNSDDLKPFMDKIIYPHQSTETKAKKINRTNVDQDFIGSINLNDPLFDDMDDESWDAYIAHHANTHKLDLKNHY